MNCVTKSSSVLVLIACLLLIPTISNAQATIKVNDQINFRIGTLIQAWADATQDPATKGYANNVFLRRIRILVGGQLSPNITFFFESDNPNLGKAPKTLGGGFITQDAFIEWKPTGSNAFMLDAGLMFVPLCRNCLESAASLLSLDYGSFTFTQSAATQSSVGRDTGFQGKGYLAGGHFEYRAAVFSGVRGAGARNALRTSARLQYNPWDTETGYLYPGLYLGNRRVAAIGAGFDQQQDYRAISVDGFISLPGRAVGTAPAGGTAPRNALNAEVTLLGFDGGTTLTSIPEQKTATAQVGYYLAGPKFMPWLRLEKQDFRSSANNSRDNNRQQLGVTWFPNGNNFNLKAAYSRIDPRAGNTTNGFTIQLQFFYY
jgi:hypothetical protein